MKTKTLKDKFFEKTVECAALGIRTKESTAERIDALVKSLPKDKAHEYRRKAVLAPDTRVETGERCDISYVSTRVMDRDKEVVLPGGIDRTEFSLCPTVLFMHDQSKPVGIALWTRPNDRGVIAKTHYPPRPKDYVGEWLSDFVLEMLVAGVIRGKSIGFLPVEVRDPTPDELAVNPDLQNVIVKSILLEYSVVSVPSNPLSVVETVEKGTGLDYWGIRAAGRGGRTTGRPPPTTVAEELAKLAPLDPDKIAALAVKRLLRRWDV